MWAARTLGQIGEVHRLKRSLGEARTYLQQAVTDLRAVGDRRGEAMVLLEVALLEQEEDRPGLAMDLTDRCLAVFEEVDDPWWQDRAIRAKINLLESRGRREDAERLRDHARHVLTDLDLASFHPEPIPWLLA